MNLPAVRQAEVAVFNNREKPPELGSGGRRVLLHLDPSVVTRYPKWKADVRELHIASFEDQTD